MCNRKVKLNFNFILILKHQKQVMFLNILRNDSVVSTDESDWLTHP